MANATWPTLLPWPLVENVSYQADDNVISTQMDAGPPKRRRRFTSVSEKVTFTLELKAGELQILQDFVAITLKDVLPFDWAEFRLESGQLADGTSNTATYRFTRRPRYRPVDNTAWLVDIELELLSGSLTRSLTEQTVNPTTGERESGVAIVAVLLGQSLNVSRGTEVLESSWDKAFMPVDAVAISDFDFASANVEHTANWDSLASAVPLAEGTGQSPAVGIAQTLEGSDSYARAYLCSVAIGARTLSVLSQGGPRCNLYALTHRLCELARADGYTPKVVFYSAHGEADAVVGTTEASYYANGIEYYQMAQLVARQAMEDPTYLAPVFLTYPTQQKEDQDDRNIKEAIRRIAQDMDGAMAVGPVYQWPCENDLVHPTPAGYVMRGEAVGRAIKAYLESGSEPAPLHITGVTLSGSTFVATFSASVVRDSSLGVASALAGTDGFEWLDNGTPIAISNLVYSGATVTGTLASTPVGTVGQQVLRIAEQYKLPNATAPANLSGSYVRKNSAGWASTYDPTYINYEWAIPQSCDVSAA